MSKNGSRVTNRLADVSEATQPEFVAFALSKAEVDALATLNAQWREVVASALAARGYTSPENVQVISDANGRTIGLKVAKKA